MKVKRIISAAMVLFFSVSNILPISANGISGEMDSVFSSVPDERDIELMNNHQEYKYGSWIITPDGDKVAINESDRQTRDYLSGIVLWTFKSYIPNATDSYDYKHFVSSVSLKNNSSQEIPLKYTQENTTTVEWVVEGNVDVDADLEFAIFGELQASFGLGVSKTTTSQASTEVEFVMPIPPYKTGKISKYYAGKYSGGKAVWEGENVIGGDYVGIKEELCGAWAIAANEVNYVYDEY